jgi:hypothetical protein
MASEIEFLRLSAEEAGSIAAEWLFERPDLKILERSKAIDAGRHSATPISNIGSSESSAT